MNKPRLFIGSSVEGLTVAYALQNNLTHSAEITVWDQGVFNLTQTALESLTNHLDVCDFGIFVITPDDEIKIRNKKETVARDNVLFELGMFIGKLGKSRCFIVLPDNAQIHLPTDLLGIIPGKYEANRSDGNLQAGTGNVANKIRESISKLGPLIVRNDQPETKPDVVSTTEDVNWYGDLYVSKKYDSAIAKLKVKLKKEKEPITKIWYKAKICFAKYHIDSTVGIKEFEKLISEHPKSNTVYLEYANAFYEKKLVSKAIEILDKGLINCTKKITLTIRKSDYLWLLGQKDEAITIITNALEITKDADLYRTLCEYKKETNKIDEALAIIQKGFLEFPTDKELMFEFGRLAGDAGHKDVSLYIFKELTNIDSNTVDYWGYLGNAALGLNLNNVALTAYEKANALSSSQASWILANIGNLYNNAELYDKAEYHLKASSELQDQSEYTHSRLSSVFSNKEKENKKFEEHINAAIKKINFETLTPIA